MPNLKLTPVADLHLDRKNYRALPQKTEEDELQVLVDLDSGYFWGLAKSLLEDGCMPTENIVVLKDAAGKMTVKEGNRRVSALKLALKLLKGKNLDMPADIKAMMGALPESWKAANREIWCAIYDLSEEAVAKKIVARTHAKGQKASRLDWPSVATARYEREENGKKVPELDLLEKYLKHGANVTDQERHVWGSDYHLSVLEAAIPRLAARLGEASAADLVKNYPTITHRPALEKLLLGIGRKLFGFDELRSKDPDILLTQYGIPPFATMDTTTTSTSSSGATGGTSGTSSKAAGGSGAGTATTPGKGTSKAPAYALDNPKSVMRNLKLLQIFGKNRDKVATLRDEISKLKLDKHPISFCFLLRSMFEISAQAYYLDHKASGAISIVDNKGKDRKLVAILKDIEKHIEANSTDPKAKSRWHGAIVELSKPESVLSVTSMNQLVHHKTFSLKQGDISSMFNNIFPLLEAMNS